MRNTSPLRGRTIKERLRDGEVTVGPASLSSSPTVVETIGYTGFDWVFIDTEQAAIGIGNDLEHLIRAADASGIPTIVRVPEAGLASINKVLNMGAQGIWVPHVESVEEAKLSIDAARYPPLGRRGACPVIRSTEQGFYDWDEYTARVNDQILMTLTIETVAGLEHVEEIAAVPGVDSLCIGPFDLGVDMGLPTSAHYTDGPELHPDLEAAMQRVLKACKDNDLIPATFAWNAAALERCIDLGFRNLLFGTDTALIRQALQTCKGEIDAIKDKLGAAA
jgi:4-hydroxy-2-oxoheptanedioate aldolase